MKSMHSFIIHIPKAFNETFKTESGIELYADKNISADKLSVRVATVINPPMLFDTPIRAQCEVMIDDTVVKQMIFKGVQQDSAFLVDKEKSYYKIEPEMIVLWRKDAESQWQANGNNLMVEWVEKEVEIPITDILNGITASDITANVPHIKPTLILELPKKKEFVKGRAKVLYPSQDLIDQNVKTGDEIFIEPGRGIPYYVDGKTWYHLHNRHVLGVVEQKILRHGFE